MRQLARITVLLALATAACEHTEPDKTAAMSRKDAGHGAAADGRATDNTADPNASASAAPSDGGLGDGPQATVPVDPDLVMRGSYLAYAYGCAACHTPIGPNGPDFSHAFAGRAIVPDMLGTLPAPNLTPDATGLAGWSDEQITDAIQKGQRPDGTMLDASMPYHAYANMTRADVRAIVAFLHTLPPVDNPVPRARKPATPASMAISQTTIARAAVAQNVAIEDARGAGPRSGGKSGVAADAGVGSAKLAEGPIDPVDDPVAHGRYLVAMMGCAGCHAAPGADGKLVAAKAFSGGRAFDLPLSGTGTLYAPNLTSDRATGLGTWKRADIEAALHTLTKADGSAIQGPMAIYGAYWTELDSRDLDAVAAYVKSLPAVRHAVPKSDFVARVATDTPGIVPGGIALTGGEGNPVLLGNIGTSPKDYVLRPGGTGSLLKSSGGVSGVGGGMAIAPGGYGSGSSAIGGGGTANAGLGAGGAAAGGSAATNMPQPGVAGASMNGPLTNTVSTPPTSSGVSISGAYGTQSTIGGATNGSNAAGSNTAGSNTASSNAAGSNASGSAGGIGAGSSAGSGTGATNSIQPTTQPSSPAGQTSNTPATPGAPNPAAPSTAGTGTTSTPGSAPGGAGAGK